MSSGFDWSGLGPCFAVSVGAVVLTAWQVSADRSVFDDLFGALHPVVVMVAAALAGLMALAYLQGSSGFAIVGPGRGRDAALIVAWAAPLLALVAVTADVLLRFDDDTNVAMPDAFRFYPAVAVFVEFVLHAVPLALLVAFLGAPTAFDATFWRVAIPVAMIEAVLQAVYATSLGTSVFSAVHLMVFGVAQVWMFWRFGFISMFGFRLAYYALWHVAWGAARLELLF